MKAYVNPDQCVGCGLCCDLCSGVFQMNDQGQAEAVRPAEESEQEAVQAAIDSCPVSAISEV